MNNTVSLARVRSRSTLARLTIGGRLFLWGFRSMAQHHRCGRPSIDAMRQVYKQFDLEDAVVSLDALVEAFAQTAHTPIEIHSPCCPCVSLSEALLLRAVAATQSGTLDVARRSFGRWLPDLAADWVLCPACGLGQLFRKAGFTLPIDETAHSYEPATIRGWPGAPGTLH
jgi:hypothetical protein